MDLEKEIEKALRIAMSEIGDITPWFDNDVKEWIFSHYRYPVECGGDSKKEVIENYPKYLKEYLAHYFKNKVANVVLKKADHLPNIETIKALIDSRSGDGEIFQTLDEFWDAMGIDIVEIQSCENNVQK